MPVERAGNKLFDSLHHAIDEARRPWIYRADRGYFALGRIARVEQRQEIGEGQTGWSGIRRRMTGTDTLPNLADNFDQFLRLQGRIRVSAAHVSCSRWP
jgi:hypothetical protein